LKNEGVDGKTERRLNYLIELEKKGMLKSAMTAGGNMGNRT
jgi:hypothetical protein